MAENVSREQIRQAYKISDNDAPTKMIPATKKININEDGRPLKVCAYCRVSTYENTVAAIERIKQAG